MPKSLRCKIKKLCYNGTLTERERDRILKALDQEEAQSSSNEFFNFDAPMVKNSEAVSSKICEYCERATPLVTDKSGDKGISLMYPNTLSAYGYDINGANSNGICAKINYCPMCGKELEDRE